MLFENEQHREILRTRILFNALIKTVLFCWNHGCPIGNPNKDIRFLARNKHLVTDSLVNYFRDASSPVEDMGKEKICLSITDDIQQLTPFSSTIQNLHDAVMESSRLCARQIIGNTPLDTLQNMILFFEQHANKPSTG
jgi:hypothetical protein